MVKEKMVKEKNSTELNTLVINGPDISMNLDTKALCKKIRTV